MNYERSPQAAATKEEREDDAPSAGVAPEVIAARTSEEETVPPIVSAEGTAGLKFSPEPGHEIDVVTDGAKICAQLERVEQLIMAAGKREAPSAREAPQEKKSEKEVGRTIQKETATPRLAQLKEVKAKLEEQNEQLGVAGEWQSALDTLHTVDAQELDSLQKTGRRRSGERLRGRQRELDPLEAMRLASLASHGVRRLTWGKFGELLAELMAVAETVLTDALSPLKRILGLRA